jgi:hypothetical protein
MNTLIYAEGRGGVAVVCQGADRAIADQYFHWMNVYVVGRESLAAIDGCRCLLLGHREDGRYFGPLILPLALI